MPFPRFSHACPPGHHRTSQTQTGQVIASFSATRTSGRCAWMARTISCPMPWLTVTEQCVCVCVSVCVFLYLCIFCILGAATNFLILATYKLSKYEITVSLKAMFFWVRKRVTRLIGWKMLINELPGMHIQLLLKDEKITSNTCDQNESKNHLALFCLVFNSFETTWAWISAASVFPDSFEGAARLQCVFHRSVPTGAPVQIFRTVQMHGHGYQLDVHHS